MLIDWFTVGAQIVNFLVLVGLLKYFLYEPILKAMDKREQTIAHRLEEAEAQKRKSERQADEYRKEWQELQENRSQMLAEAKSSVEQERQELFEQARREVGEVEQEWQKAIEREKTSFANALSQAVARQCVSVARKALRELADTELEDRIIGKFLQALRDLKQGEIERIRESSVENDTIVAIQSTFEIDPDRRKEIKRAISEKIGGDLQIRFDQSSELISGIAIRIGGHRISWAIDDYLVSIEQEASRIIDAKSSGSRASESHVGSS